MIIATVLETALLEEQNSVYDEKYKYIYIEMYYSKSTF